LHVDSAGESGTGVLKEAAGFGLGIQQSVNVAAQLGIVSACFVQVGGAFPFGTFV